MEECNFFSGSGYRLFGCLHWPEGSNRRCGVVFCEPFAEEKLWSQRVMVNFSRLLARRGYTILRFDFMGHGDSDGDFEDSDVDTRLSDIGKAMEFLKKRAEVRDVGLLGLRWGATLSAIWCERNGEADFMILWEPILDGNAYVQQCLRSSLATQMAAYKKVRYTREQMIKDLEKGQAVNVDGYLISGSFFRQASAIDLTRMAVEFHGPVLIVRFGSGHDIGANEGINRLCENYRRTNPNSNLVEVAEKPFWKDIRLYYQRAGEVFQASLDWLENIGLKDCKG